MSIFTVSGVVRVFLGVVLFMWGIAYAYVSLPFIEFRQALSQNGYYANSGKVFVERVIPGSKAEAVGIEPGDVIVSVSGTSISSKEQFLTTLNTLRGTTIQLHVIRSKRSLKFDVYLDSVSDPVKGLLGVMVSDMSIKKASAPEIFLHFFLNSFSYQTLDSTALLTGNTMYSTFAKLFALISFVASVGVILRKHWARYVLGILCLVLLSQVLNVISVGINIFSVGWLISVIFCVYMCIKWNKYVALHYTPLKLKRK